MIFKCTNDHRRLPFVSRSRVVRIRNGRGGVTLADMDRLGQTSVMAFRYARSSPTQYALTLGGLALVGLWLSLDGAQATWSAWLDATPAWFHFVGAVYVIHGIIFWGLAAFFAAVERSGKPRWIARTKIQDEVKGRPATRDIVRVLAINQLFWTPLILLGIWQALELRGWSSSAPLPSVGDFLLEMAGLSLVSPIYFYASHRFLHRRWWMRRVHRVHHEFRTSAVIASEYAHWFEFIVGNFGTMAFGILVIEPSLLTIWVFAGLGTLTFSSHHSGYAVPLLPCPMHHDWHHYRYREAFGTYDLLDRLFRTQDELDALNHGDVVGARRPLEES